MRKVGGRSAHSADRRGQSATLRFDLAVGLAHRRPAGMDPRGSHLEISPTGPDLADAHSSFLNPSIHRDTSHRGKPTRVGLVAIDAIRITRRISFRP